MLGRIFTANKNYRKSLVSFTRPHKAIGTQTMARWFKVVLKEASIDIATFKPHSTMYAASTAALRGNMPVDEIPKRADWTSLPPLETFIIIMIII